MTHEQMDELHRALWTLREYLDDDANVPERFESSLAGNLAESDADAIMRASQVVHRLMLWRKFPSVSQESYFARPSGDVVARIADYSVKAS